MPITLVRVMRDPWIVLVRSVAHCIMSCSILLILRELIPIMAVSTLELFFSPFLSSILRSFPQLISLSSLQFD
jgi:hypothetical protein